jgi:alkaline phosphatase D
VLVDDLAPGTGYHYVFGSNGDRITGRTRTLPLAARGLRIAVVCCSRWGWPGFDRLASVVSERPDLVLHLGDYIYEVGESPPDGPTTDPRHDCRTLDDYRRRYRQHRSHPSLRRLHAEVPFIAVWDDHEVSDNAPQPGDDERRAAGQRAWREWMPTRSLHDDAPLDRRLSIDGLLELVLVDSRYRRRPPVDTDGPSTSRPDTPLLDERQWSNVESAAATVAPWLVVANQVHVSPLRLGWMPRWRWPPWRPLVNPDQWDGFPAERRRLIDVLDGAQGTPVLLSGDLHAGWSRRLLHHGRTIAHELTAPSISGTTFAEAVQERTGLPGRIVRRIVRWLNPGIDHVDLDRHGFLLVDVAPEQLTATFVHHDGTRTTRTLGSSA